MNMAVSLTGVEIPCPRRQEARFYLAIQKLAELLHTEVRDDLANSDSGADQQSDPGQ